MSETDLTTGDFIRQIVADDLRANRRGGRVHTRFPPEPNGYLHIGHAKAICLNFGIAREPGGLCNLRMDDTNPETEDEEFVRAIEGDVRWLGADWGDRLYYASDYFDRLYNCAVQLITTGRAYVDDLRGDEVGAYRGRWNEPGRNSPYRDRSVDKNLDLFDRMRRGEFEDGSRTLRARIDMAAPNMNLRDPTIYRIRRSPHYRQGDTWCIYPTYDFTHPLSDAFEGVTHSLCTLEFEDHRPLYDWYLEQLAFQDPPRQIEFARLNLTHTVLSKRRLRALVEGGHVDGWDDPRMPTLSGLRRRGYTPVAIRDFCERIGVAKANSVVQLAQLEDAIRQDLNVHSPRVMAVLRPLRVVIDNYPEDQVEELDAVNNPEDTAAGTRKVPFSRVLFIEQDDFHEDPPRKYFRLAPGREVRLRYAYFITCVAVVKDPVTGAVVELRCTYDPETRGGHAPDGRKVRGTIHWVSEDHAVAAEVRLYGNLFSKEFPEDLGDGEDYKDALDESSLDVLTGCYVERSVAAAPAAARYQFERQGYFCVDPDSSDERLVFNRTVTLRDSWAKLQKKGGV
jgi:glutaminyl-tRNA synthetase